MADEADIEPLLDILELIERIERQTSRMDKLGFLGDPDAQDAMAYRLLAIGEASLHLSAALKVRNPQIPWHQIAGLRNLLAHEYFVRESDLIWETACKDLPALAETCRIELGPLKHR